jgi:prolyl-tRNA synthetase
MSSTIFRASQYLLPTLKEAPSEAVAASHQLLLRGGFIRQLGAGLYNLLPLGVRSLRKIERILQQEMAAAGAQEFRLPSLHPAELWRSSGRWDEVDETLFRLRDRRGGDYCLALTHEEIFTAIAAAELQSYRQLPQRWYQIGLKFRDEPRPKAGLLRVREFHMKDAYSFDIDEPGLDAAFEAMKAAYVRIFARCALRAFPADAFSGAMGGSESIEFVVSTPAGEDEVLHCPECGYAANLEVARSHMPAIADAPSTEVREFATPGVVTIDALASPPYNVAPTRQLKTLVYIADSAPVVAVVRGDHQLNEAKLQVATGATRVRPADGDEVFALMGAHIGSLGAVRFAAARILLDESVATRANMVTGANRDGFHVSGVDVQRDIAGEIADLRTARAGEGCPECGAALDSFTALEVGHIFKLGTRYSVPMNATVLGPDGVRVPVVMGSYGIGLERLLAAVVEAHHDARGIVWPMSVAPFGATVLTIGSEPELAEVATRVVDELAAGGLDVLYDDRDERAGVKFNDADLIGIPLRITVGRRGLADATVESKLRWEDEIQRVPISDIAARAAALLRGPAE